MNKKSKTKSKQIRKKATVAKKKNKNKSLYSKLINNINPLGSKKTRLLSFALVFGVIGVVTVLLSSASVTNSFEAENATAANTCSSVVSDADAVGGKAVKFACGSTTSSTNGFVHPGVIYTKADLDNFSTNSTEYQRLSSNSISSLNLSSVPVDFRPKDLGTRIDSGGEAAGMTGPFDAKDKTKEYYQGFTYPSQYLKIQALLWAADKNATRKSNVEQGLSKFKTVTSIEWDRVEQWRLISGWSCTNLAVAAEIVDYRDAQFQRFLRDVCYPIMDWWGGGNWHASFADSKLAIAAYLGDAELWADAKAYFYERIKQSFYHSKYDGNKIYPMHSEDRFWVNQDGTRSVEPRIHTTPGTPRLNQTQQQWSGHGLPSQVNGDYTYNTASYGLATNGMNAEQLRDYGHVNMGLAAWAHGARTILAQGEKLEQHAYDRLLEGYSYHADRVLYYAQTGTHKAPVVQKGDGGGGRFNGYELAKAIFGKDTPASVNAMLERSEVKTRFAAEALHFAGDYFAASQSIPIYEQTTAPTTGVLTSSVNAAVSGEYTLWVRMRAADATNNAVKAEIASATFKVGDNGIYTTGWTWVNYNNANTSSLNKVLLTAGNHNVTLTGIEPGVLVDKVMILNTDCRPARDGSNCDNKSPSVSISSPTNGQEYDENGNIVIVANASDSDGTVSKVEFYEGENKLGETSSTPYQYTWQNVPAGSYNISARAYDDFGASTTSSLVSVIVNVTPPPTPDPEPEPTPDPTPTPTPTGELPAPSNLQVQGASRDEIKLVWDKPNDPRVDQYSLRYTRADSPTATNYSTWTYPAPFSGESYTMSNLDKGTTYVVQVRSRDSKKTSITSDDTISKYGPISEVSTQNRRWWWWFW